MKIAVTGATGQLGRLVLAELAERGASDVVALVRNPERAGDLGVATREFDYDRPETLAPALAGVDRLLFISANDLEKRAPQHRAVIDAAREAGVGHVVYTSILHADRSTLALAPDHRETERLLAESGLEHTLLRNGWYAENYAGAVQGALATGTLAGAAGDGRISAAPRSDYAAAAAAVLTGEGHAGRVYELAGDTSFSMEELAGDIARVSGKPITYRNLTVAEYADALEQGAGMPAPVAAMFAGMDAEIEKGALQDDSGELSALIGRPTVPMSDVVPALVG